MVSDELTHLSKRSSSNCLIMVPEFPQSPFFKQPINIKPHLQLLKTTASQVVSQLHSSISSTADKYFALLHMLASKSPLLCKLLSFSSHLQSLSSQINVARIDPPGEVAVGRVGSAHCRELRGIVGALQRSDRAPAKTDIVVRRGNDCLVPPFMLRDCVALSVPPVFLPGCKLCGSMVSSVTSP